MLEIDMFKSENEHNITITDLILKIVWFVKNFTSAKMLLGSK